MQNTIPAYLCGTRKDLRSVESGLIDALLCWQVADCNIAAVWDSVRWTSSQRWTRSCDGHSRVPQSFCRSHWARLRVFLHYALYKKVSKNLSIYQKIEKLATTINLLQSFLFFNNYAINVREILVITAIHVYENAKVPEEMPYFPRGFFKQL